jgi:hypothetical protein
MEKHDNGLADLLRTLADLHNVGAPREEQEKVLRMVEAHLDRQGLTLADLRLILDLLAPGKGGGHGE